MHPIGMIAQTQPWSAAKITSGWCAYRSGVVTCNVTYNVSMLNANSVQEIDLYMVIKW